MFTQMATIERLLCCETDGEAVELVEEQGERP